MKIKRTIKPDYPESGQVEVIGEERMRNIVRQTRLSNMTARSKEMTGTDEAMLQLQEGRTLETFYAIYEPLPD